jgi:DNA-binding PadR family transcriptional regulator
MGRIEINVQTGERKVVELTDAELAQAAKDKAEWDIEYAKRQEAETRKQQREALLDKMLAERADAPEWMKVKK